MSRGKGGGKAGLFTRFGRAPSAAGALGVGALSWLVATYAFEATAPYLVSLGAATVAYVALAH